MKFGSWTYDGLKLDVHFYDNKSEIDISDYIPSNEWYLVGHPAKKFVEYYVGLDCSRSPADTAEGLRTFPDSCCCRARCAACSALS